MQDIYVTFEFNKVKELISSFSKTELGKEYILSLTMYKSKEEVIDKLEDLKEVMSLITRFGELPIETSADAIKLISLAKKTGMLTPRDFNLIANDAETINKINKYFSKIDDIYPRIKDKTSKFIDLTNLEKEIRRVITNSLTVADNATSELKEIRKDIKRVENELDHKIASLAFTYSSYLSDDNSTIRDGHFVLPVKTVEKSHVLGVVHDVSSSGATTFIEPLEIVELNNKLTALKVKENDEVRKILKQLTNLVLLQEGEIINNNSIIGELDFLSSKALYAFSISGEVANISNKQEIILLDSRHPLIDKDKVVSNSYKIDEEKRIVIISGPNAGGKTVSLKSVGLLVLMNQCGLALPTSKATLGYFKNIYIDIGDNQSLSDNLSTFSAHMSHISEIVDIVKGKDLVLLDELGTGTDPKEGEALALATVKYLENKNCLAMISSHFEGLKEYAFLSKNLENSSMIFDEEKLVPTYKYRLGNPGRSYGLDVAKRYGINLDIIEEANRFLKENSSNDASELLLILQSKIEQTTLLEDELNKKQNQLTMLEKKLEVEKDNLETRKINLLKDVENDKKQLISQTKQQINEIISSLNKEGIKLHEVIELKGKLDELETSKEVETFNEEIRVDDYVLVPSLNISGKVMRINKNKAHIQSDDGISFDVDINKLTHTSAPKKVEKKKVNYSTQINTSLSLEKNLIGMHVEEASRELAKYIDDCILHNLSQVRIIHGFGSGALRKMTREYLDSHKIKYRPADSSEGAGGATVVILRES